MRIADILRKKGTGVVTIESSATVHDAIRKLNEHGIGSLVALGDSGEIDGIITERDILVECGERCTRLLGMPEGRAGDCPSLVRDVMTRDVIIGVPDDELSYVMGVMTKNRIRHLPILDDGKLAGIVSIGDVVNAHVVEKEYENRVLKEYIQGATY